MFYMVWIAGDSDDFGWFFVFPTKTLAMRTAKGLANGKQVAYLPVDTKEDRFCYNPATTIVVEQRDYFYHGA